jgi:hypothetical protein
MRLSENFVEYFKSMAEEAGIPYQSLINLYLRDGLASSQVANQVATSGPIIEKGWRSSSVRSAPLPHMIKPARL